MDFLKRYWPLILFVAVFLMAINLALGAAGVENAFVRALGTALACGLGILAFQKWGARMSGHP